MFLQNKTNQLTNDKETLKTRLLRQRTEVQPWSIVLPAFAETTAKPSERKVQSLFIPQCFAEVRQAQPLHRHDGARRARLVDVPPQVDLRPCRPSRCGR